MRGREARKIVRDAHAQAALKCCGIKFSSKLALSIHKRDHKKANKNRVYDE